MKTCETCKFYDWYDDESGYCTWHPPPVIMAIMRFQSIATDINFAPPSVRIGQSCSEHKDKPND